MLLSEALQLFKSEYISLKGLSLSTEENYEDAVQSFIKLMGDMSLETMTPHDVVAWKRKMEQSNKPGTIRCRMSKLKNILIFTNEQGISSFNTNQITLPKLPPNLPKFLYDYEIELLFNTAPTIRDKAMVLLLFTSGVRAGELSALDRGDIDGDRISIRKGKGNTSRCVMMSARTRMYVEEYLSTRIDNSPILFLSYRNGRYKTNSISGKLKKWAKDAGIKKDVSAHVMRHSCATHMVLNGIDTSYVQKQLGHAYISTTQIYIHLSDAALASAHKKVFA